MADLVDLGMKVRNTTNRQSNLFLKVHTGSNYEFRNMGRIAEASFSSDAEASDADQHGRESAQLLNITVSFSMMQASNFELSLLGELAMPSDEANFSNGHAIYASGSRLVESDLNDNLTGDGDPDYTVLGDTTDDPADPDGIYFKNVLLKPTPDIDLMGDESVIGVEFTGLISYDEFSDFHSSPLTSDGNHIVVSPS